MQRISRRSGVQAGQARRTSSLSALLFPRRGTGRQTDRRRGRRAFTLAELLVCLGVAGLLMSLILPAIQQTRESARQTQCRNNLRQLGLACQEHVAAHGFFPPDLAHAAGIGNTLSVHYSLLPFVDQAELYRRIRFPELGHSSGAEPPKSDFNSEWMFVTLAVFRCPSDTVPPGAIHYRANDGSGPIEFHPTRPLPLCGPIGKSLRYGRPHETLDGLTNTALMSEVLPGDQRPEVFDPLRDTFFADPQYVKGPDGVLRERDWREVCGGPPAVPYWLPNLNAHHSYGGSTWLFGTTRFTLYRHDLPPNSPVPSCGAYVRTAARSLHPGLVNLVMGDASVKKASDKIDFEVWKALGTRAGQEQVVVSFD